MSTVTLKRDGCPLLQVLDGEGMSADDAAWLSVADGARHALTLPGLSSASTSELEALLAAALRCAHGAA